MIRVLAIDGGGVRGLVPATVVAELERRAATPASSLFDVMAGTSTGSIIALGLSVPDAAGRAKWSAAQVVEFYLDHAPRIFAQRHRDAIRNLGGLLHEKYSADGLERTLEFALGDARLSDALNRVIVPAYDVARRTITVFDTDKAREDPSEDAPMWAAARASAAAPTFFEPSLFTEHPDGDERVFIDGGVVANNPAMLAFTEAAKHHLGEDIMVVSLGCGSSTQPLRWKEVREWGLAQWARPLFHVLMCGASQVTHFELRELLGADRYFRFQPVLDRAGEELDDSRPANLASLHQHARELIEDNDETLDQICKLLVG